MPLSNTRHFWHQIYEQQEWMLTNSFCGPVWSCRIVSVGRDLCRCSSPTSFFSPSYTAVSIPNVHVFFIIFEWVLSPHLSQSHIGRWRLQSIGAAFWPAHHHCGQTQPNSRVAGPPSPWVDTCKSAQTTWPPRTPFPKRPARSTQGQTLYYNLSTDDLIFLGTCFWVDYSVDNKNTQT